jgi:hypothetical protein
MGTNYYIDEKCQELHFGKVSCSVPGLTFTWYNKGKEYFDDLYKKKTDFFVYNENGERFLASTFIAMVKACKKTSFLDIDFC